MRLNPTHLLALAAAALMLATASPASAYLGPGLGLGAIGAVLGVIGSLFLGLAAIIWYPVKRLIRKLKGTKRAAESTTPED